MWVRFLGREDPLELGMATHSSIRAWRMPWTEEPGGLYSPQVHKESDTTEATAHIRNVNKRQRLVYLLIFKKKSQFLFINSVKTLENCYGFY